MRRVTTAVLAVFAAAALAGCGGSRTSDEPSTTGATTTAPVTTTTATLPSGGQLLRVYFLRDGAVAPVARHVQPTSAVARSALEQLLAGPTNEERAAGLTTDVPAQTQLLGVTVANGEATVDLSDDFAHGAEATIAPRLAEIVYTLTQFSSVAKVAFDVAGKPLDLVVNGNGSPLDHPATRDDYEALTPLILVESPLPGEEVTSPVHVSGTANVFEATFQLELQSADGSVVAKQTVTASSGAPQRGTFDVSVPVDAKPGAVELHAFDENQGTGEREHEVAIPLTLSG